MKLAILSDIHANLPALQAVLKDMKKHQPDIIYCLGDLVNFAGWDNEVVSLIRSNNIPCVQGNHDTGIGLHQTDFPFSYKTEVQKKFGYKSIEKVNERISEENRKYLSELPFLLQTEFRFASSSLKIVMVHGSTWSNTEYVQKDTKDEYLLHMLNTVKAQVLLMGHTHVPYYKKIIVGTKDDNIHYHVINVGSVGKPGHGNNQSCYCLLDIGKPSGNDDPVPIQVNFEFVSYNVYEVINHIKESGLSDAYDEFLLEGTFVKTDENFKTIQ